MKKISYSTQYDIIYSQPLVTSRPLAKPSQEAQANEMSAKVVIGSDVYAVGKRNLLFNRRWDKIDLPYVGYMILLHALTLFAPATFSWTMFFLLIGGYFVSGCLGITLSYHRQLSHRSFKTHKSLEYLFAYCGALSVQGDPIDWVSSHRYHHLNTDTPLDPHSPYEGLWWSHLGWILDSQATNERVKKRNNAIDIIKQPFYQVLRKTYIWHVVCMFAAYYLLGGFAAVVWGCALRCVLVYHITWGVNSVAHIWGNRPYETGDLSTNNLLIGLLAFGEGWHCAHHKYEFSVRHGLEWWQVDLTWYLIASLEKLGLAYDVRLPTPAQIARDSLL